MSNFINQTTNRCHYEKELIKKGCNFIAGVDEVGRGPLAGPMVTAAVIFDKDTLINIYDAILEISNETKINNTTKLFIEIRDSKKISEKKRINLANFIQENALYYNIVEIPNKVLDKQGIASATQFGFFEAINKLGKFPDFVLTDNFSINALPKHKQLNIIKGDDNSISIAAASIIAKVYRDNLMIELDKKHPNYGFKKHKGYGTKQHREAIIKYGPCEIHRRSFEPIKSMLQYH